MSSLETEIEEVFASVEVYDPSVERDEYWWLQNPYLEVTENGKGIGAPTVPACRWWLERDGVMNGVRLETMTQEITCRNGLPWNKERTEWRESDFGHLLDYMQRRYRYNGKAVIRSLGNLRTAFMNYVDSHSYDRLTEMLNSLPKWDGVKRKDRLFVDFLGAPDIRYTWMCTDLLMYAAIARAFKPGCKYDYMVILKSKEQGIGKSTIFNKLAMDDDFFIDDIKGIGKKEAQELIQGKWIVESAELSSLKGPAVGDLKNFITQKRDNYRVPYDRKPSKMPRRCVLVGTTNDDQYLSDPTGNRRFLPIVCEGERRLDVMRALTPEYVQQVWAEALVDYRNDPDRPLILPKDLEEEANAFREDATVEDPWIGLANDYLDKEARPGRLVCTLEVLTKGVGIDRDKVSRSDTMRMSNIISRIPGWDKCGQRTVAGYGRQKAFRYQG